MPVSGRAAGRGLHQEVLGERWHAQQQPSPQERGEYLWAQGQSSPSHTITTSSLFTREDDHESA
jgi:hypothetical protein